ncbi:MAG: hypothetical protein MMC33_003571 [Icmadophila ericetorum]|nr:hypothetical protein [Icmadophila ericetorum]
MSISRPKEQNQRRTPLSDATSRVNNLQPVVAATGRSHAQPQSQFHREALLPHQDPLKPRGNLLAPPAPLSARTAVENKRLSALARLDQRAANRASQVSIASTNATIASGNVNQKLKTCVGPWKLGPTLGKGATGRVRKATHRETGQVAAIKIISMNAASQNSSESIRDMSFHRKMGEPQSGKAFGNTLPPGIEREIVLLQLIDHPNVITLYDIWKNRGELYLVLEIVDGGDLFQFIETNGRLQEWNAVRLFRQLISGLAYCHRFRICHRDLKPENILIDKDCNLKIADFGMAALQPAGLDLKTSCGSPHYAAPEIAVGHPYQGDLADIWSCGVVLYVMLASQVPFGGGRQDPNMPDRINADLVLWDVVHAELVLPEFLSPKAQDFLERVLQRDPNQRIRLEDMWKHPLLSQYEQYAKKPENMPYWLGGPLEKIPTADCEKPTTECGKPIMKRSQLDENLLQTLCTLFYHIPKSIVIGSILDDRPNYEKCFYNRLKKFQDEQLEWFEGSVSRSDHHHIQKPVRRSSTRASLQPSTHKRRWSQYSITAEPVLRTSQSYRRAPSSVADTDMSYDPFRASRRQMTEEAEHAYITILHGQSNTPRGTRMRSNTASLRHRALARHQGDEGLSIGPSLVSVPSAAALQIHQLRRERLVRNYSRSSLASSQRRQSTPVIVRTSVSYKRGVSFHHVRKLSDSDAVPRIPKEYATPPTLKERFQRDRLMQSSPELSPPASGGYLMVRSRKRPSSQTHEQELASRNENQASQCWKEDARKVSLELEKVCDEAFNEPQIGKYNRSNTLLSIPEVHSPKKPQPVSQMSRETREKIQQRPLPQPPTAETTTQRELARTMNLLKRKAADPQAGFQPGQLDDVIAHLERLMQPTTRLYESEYDRRTTSAPDAKFLSPVKEEDVRLSWVTEQSSPTRSRLSFRAVSEPMGRRDPNRAPRPTIRKVDNDIYGPISPVQPLVIRKRSAGSTASNGNLRSQSNQGRQETHGTSETSPFQFNDNELDFNFKMPVLEDGRPASFPETAPKPFDDEFIDKDSRAMKAKSSEVKKRSWFNRSHPPPSKNDPEQPPSPPAKNSPKKTGLRDAGRGRKTSQTSSEEFPSREDKKEKPSAREKLLKIFSKKDSKDSKGSQDSKGFSTEDDLFDDADSFAPSSAPYPYMSGGLHNGSSSSVVRRFYGQSLHPPRSFPTERVIQPAPQNWLARFLHIKPAKKILCFQIGKMHALKEISKLLREWRRYGMKDIVVDKGNARVFARVDAKNHLKIRPVSIAIEFFPIFKHSRPTNTSIARFTQEQGAKTSFERVCVTLEQLLTGKGMMITDKKKKRAMQACLAN